MGDEETMARPCTICNHPQKDEINQAIVNRVSPRLISKSFGITLSSLHRHKAAHLPVALVEAVQAAEVVQAGNLLDQVVALQEKTLGILSIAEAAGDIRTALMAISQARGNLELLARLMGELQNQQNTVNVLVADPDWLKLRAGIIRALEPWPAARLAVAAAIRETVNDEPGL